MNIYVNIHTHTHTHICMCAEAMYKMILEQLVELESKKSQKNTTMIKVCYKGTKESTERAHNAKIETSNNKNI